MQACIITCLIDYEKAFHSVHRETLWRIMRLIHGIPPKIIRTVQAMHRGSQCALVDGGGKADWFDNKSAFQQGGIMSGFL